MHRFHTHIHSRSTPRPNILTLFHTFKKILFIFPIAIFYVVTCLYIFPHYSMFSNLHTEYVHHLYPRCCKLPHSFPYVFNSLIYIFIHSYILLSTQTVSQILSRLYSKFVAVFLFFQHSLCTLGLSVVCTVEQWSLLLLEIE
jgi:hypothetical protein